VATMTRLRPGSIPGKDENLSVLQRAHSSSGAHTTQIQWVPGHFPPE